MFGEYLRRRNHVCADLAVRFAELSQTFINLRGDCMNKQDAEGLPPVCRSVQDRRGF